MALLFGKIIIYFISRKAMIKKGFFALFFNVCFCLFVFYWEPSTRFVFLDNVYLSGKIWKQTTTAVCSPRRHQTGVVLLSLTSHDALLRWRQRVCGGGFRGRSPSIHLQRNQRGWRAVTISWLLNVSVSTGVLRLIFWRGTKSPVTNLSFTLHPFCPRDKMLNK